MLPTNVTFKVIDRSPGSCKIFPFGYDQILYIVCGQRLICIILYLPVGNYLCTFRISPLCRFLPVGFLFNLFQIFPGFFPCCKSVYRSVTVMVILITDIVPNGKIFSWRKGITRFRDRKSLVWFNLVFFCNLLRKGKHGIHFFVCFAILQLFTDCGGINVRKIITAFKT